MCEKLFFHKVLDVLIVTIGQYWLIHNGTGSTLYFIVYINDNGVAKVAGV